MITGSFLCYRFVNLTVCYWESTLIGVNCPYVYGEALLLLVCGYLLSTSQLTSIEVIPYIWPAMEAILVLKMIPEK